MNSGAASFNVSQHEQIQAFNLVTRPRGTAQKLQARAHAGLALKAANRNALTQLVPAEMGVQSGNYGLQSYPMQRASNLLLVRRGHLFLSLPRTGTCVTMVGRTASGDTDFGGDVSFFGFLTILLVFC